MKPFKGIIRDWYKVTDKVTGVCVWHATHDNGIVDGERIYTSDIVSITHREGWSFSILETKNSWYALLGDISQ